MNSQRHDLAVESTRPPLTTAERKQRLRDGFNRAQQTLDNARADRAAGLSIDDELIQQLENTVEGYRRLIKE